MMWQTILVAIIVLAAALIALRRLISFFAKPASKCKGCSGCAMADFSLPLHRT